MDSNFGLGCILIQECWKPWAYPESQVCSPKQSKRPLDPIVHGELEFLGIPGKPSSPNETPLDPKVAKHSRRVAHNWMPLAFL